ncbi:hypothetical protein ABK905_25685 [Acerihabitans sp. KWT182]|uniref:Uncharacterized protein n=1 Tax=Acerihabitans sp. KWT182 TaxID=3157919 RepID=A0AAU7Q9R4_9GAMM
MDFQQSGVVQNAANIPLAAWPITAINRGIKWHDNDALLFNNTSVYMHNTWDY